MYNADYNYANDKTVSLLPKKPQCLALKPEVTDGIE